ALRRYQAVHWLDYLVGPLGIQKQPSEKEFISCLRNGLILCKVINKVQTNAVPKVVETVAPSPSSFVWCSQPLPAYQYFENIRNFLVAAEELKLPIFEASVFEREGAAGKVVDCILALKSYHERNQMIRGSGPYRPPRSPPGVNVTGRIHGHDPVSHDCPIKVDMMGSTRKYVPSESDINDLESNNMFPGLKHHMISFYCAAEKIIKALADCLIESKENMRSNLAPAPNNHDRISTVCVIVIFFFLMNSLEDVYSFFTQMKPNIMNYLRAQSCSTVDSTALPLADISHQEYRKNIRLLLSSVKKEVKIFQSVFQNDLRQLEIQVHEMSTAAYGYRKAVQENRNLYNVVQDLKGNIRVCCRIRPISPLERKSVIDYIGDDGTLIIVDPNHKKDGKKIFRFNCIFGPTATQEEIFRGGARPLVRSVMDGYDVCIFAYGETGSGKTHTMLVPRGASSKELGISYMALCDLFQQYEERKGCTNYDIQLRMVEIYNEQVYDLLAEDPETRKYPFAHLCRCASESTSRFPDVMKHSVKSAVEAMNLLKIGEVNRAFGSTSMNIQGSHSNSVLSVVVHGEDASGNVFDSCLHLVDLAASSSDSENNEYMNKSLVCFTDVIAALAQKNSHIPYGSSRLTSLLQSCLGGNAKILMFAHVNPKWDSLEATMSTLQFAERVSRIELGAAHANRERREALELKAQ
ncbi:hypothetical protein M569_06644, partial [Genlisea aurea]